MNFIKKITSTLSLLFLILIALGCFILFAFGGPGQKPLALNYSKNKPNSTLFFAHRGIRYFAENSLKGIEEAKHVGFRAVEVDISKSLENQFIVFHDEDGLRLLGIDKKINTIDTVTLNNNPIILDEETKTNSFVPTVEKLLKEEKNKIIFYFDMKVNSFEDADGIAKIVKDQNCLNTIIIASSDIFFVFYMEHNYPEIITALEGFNSGKEWLYYIMPKNLKPDLLSSYAMNIDEEHIKWLKKNDLMTRRIVYGVDTANIKTVLDAGFKNILVDYDSAFLNNPKTQKYFKSN